MICNTKILAYGIALSVISSGIDIPLVEPSAPALAQIPIEYVPPPGRRQATHTEGAGSRGCNVDQVVKLKLIAPQDHVGLTTSAQPTFFWYVSRPTTLPLRFTLVEQDEPEPLVDSYFRLKQGGIVKFKLPPNITLQPDREYRWTVSLICNKQRPSANMYAFTWIRRSTLPASFALQLEEAETDLEKGLVYARSGLWYDAVALLYKASFESETRLKANYFWQLLDQINLGQLGYQHSVTDSGIFRQS